MAVNFNNYYNKISNSGQNEWGGIYGGNAGDQTGREWNIVNWYNRPWNCVLRYPDKATRELIAQLAIKAANNNNIGYDQYQRNTYDEQLRRAGNDPSKITVKCESDCSAGVISNVKAVGRIKGIKALQNISSTYTGNMRTGFRAAGFQVLTDSKYLTSSAYLLPGDILLNDSAHTATNLGIGSKSGYSQTSSGSSSSVKVGRNITSTRTSEIQTMLNKVMSSGLAVDNDFGPKTTAAVLAFQKKYGLEQDGIVGNATLSKLKSLYSAATKPAPAPAKPTPAPATNIKQGKNITSTRTSEIQTMLNKVGNYGLVVDNDFGPKTTAAVVDFQKKNGLEVDGIVGNATLSKLKTAYANATKPAQSSNALTLNTSGTYNKTVKRNGQITANVLNIRKGPGTKYANLVSYPTLKYGTKVGLCDLVRGSDGGKWYYIKINDKYGFASANYIKLV